MDEEEKWLREQGFEEVEAHTLKEGDVVAFRATDIFQLEPVGTIKTGVVFQVNVIEDGSMVSVDHDDMGRDATTEADWEDLVWVKRKKI